MLNKIKNLKQAFVVSTLALLLTTGICLAAEQIINNYYGETTVNQRMLDENNATMGSVAAVDGICNGSEPTTQMCNVNVYELESQTALTAADLISSDDLTVGDDVTITGEDLNWNSLNWKRKTGTFANATTTLASFANPFSATSTCRVELMSVTNGTTTTEVMVASSTTSTIGPAGLSHGILHYEVASSTPAGIVSSGNNTVPDGFVLKETVYDNFLVGPSDYILIHATGTSAMSGAYSTALEGITGNSNTFAGTYWIDCRKN